MNWGRVRTVGAWLGLAGCAAMMAGCNADQPRRVPPLVDLPAVQEPMPTSQVVADQGKDGFYEPLAGVVPPARVFVIEPPQEARTAGGVLLVHGHWGLTADVRELARRLAALGFVVVVPDLFDGVESTSRLSSKELALGVAGERAEAQLRAGLTRLTGNARVAGTQPVVLGLGAGGEWAARFAASGATAALFAFDSTNLPAADWDKLARAGRPLLWLFGEETSGFDAAARDALMSRAQAGGSTLTLEVIPGAGTDLFDPGARGWQSASYELALTRFAALAQDFAKAD